jgi:D-psicose/D-tagatose/L-ribulose 3-epimerase
VKLSVSNIAWPAETDSQALALLRDAAVAAIEVAPTRLWPDWVGASEAAAADAARGLDRQRFRVSSLQAIVFGKPAYKLFGSEVGRQSLFEHLILCADLARGFEASSLVFGAPKNRELCGVSQAEAFAIASEFFRDVGSYFRQRGVCLCLEANPRQYGCEFVVDSSEAARLVRAVGSEGFRLHLDTGCMHLAAEDPVDAIRKNADILHHFHVSEPYLGSFDNPLINHRRVVDALADIGYSNWVTLEMRAADQPLLALAQAVRTLVDHYRGLEVT